MGDLHSHLIDYGALTAAQSQFVIGEIVAAVSSVHDAGFVFNDLKPENVLITQVGHIKITDFGACRPYSTVGHNALRSGKRSLAELRNGDWRDETDETKADKVPRHDDDDVCFADSRVEGTPAYLPLEALNPGQIRYP